MAIENYHKTIDAARDVAQSLIRTVPTVPLAIVMYPADDALPYDSWAVIRQEWLPYSRGRLIETVAQPA